MVEGDIASDQTNIEVRLGIDGTLIWHSSLESLTLSPILSKPHSHRWAPFALIAAHESGSIFKELLNVTDLNHVVEDTIKMEILGKERTISIYECADHLDGPYFQMQYQLSF